MKTNNLKKSIENLKSVVVELNKKEMESIQGGGSYIIQRGVDGIPVLHWIP